MSIGNSVKVLAGEKCNRIVRDGGDINARIVLLRV